MATTKKRLNISLSPDIEQALGALAARDAVPTATKASDLLRLALEIEEDHVWDVIASQRDRKTARFVSSKKAWA